MEAAVSKNYKDTPIHLSPSSKGIMNMQTNISDIWKVEIMHISNNVENG